MSLLKLSALLFALSAFSLAHSANALTMRQCSEKYKAAHDAGIIGTPTWNDFRKAECGPDATMALKNTKAEPSTAAAGPQECSAKYQAAKSAGTLGGMTWNEFRKAGCVAKIAAADKLAPRRKPRAPCQTPPRLAGKQAARDTTRRKPATRLRA